MLRKFFSARDIDMLNGPVFPKIVLFSVPLIITNLLQTLYNAADMIIVGLSGVEGAIGSIGTTGAMVNFFLNIFTGFAVGTGVVVARNIGKGDREGTRKSVHTALIIGAGSGLFCTLIGCLCARRLLIFLGDEGHILDLATRYAMIYFCGAPFMALTNFLIGILRAKGDTITGLIVLSCSGIANVIMNLFFVLVVGLSVEGVAIATVLANALSALLLAIRLSNDTSWCRLESKHLRFDAAAAKEIVRDGLPAAFQGSLFSLSNMVIQSSVISINNAMYPGGSAVIDGSAAAQNLEAFVYTTGNAVAQAAVTFTSQNYGARQYRRIGRVMACTCLFSFMVTGGAGLIFYLCRVPLLHCYVRDPASVEVGCTRMLFLALPYFTCGFMEIGSFTLRGLGRSFLSTIISLMGSVVFRILWISFVFPVYPSLETIFVSYPISWVLTTSVHFTVATVIRRRLIREQKTLIAAAA